MQYIWERNLGISTTGLSDGERNLGISADRPKKSCVRGCVELQDWFGVRREGAVLDRILD